MTTDFVHQIEHLRRRLQRRRLIAAACWSFSMLALAALGIVAIDRALGLRESGGRLLLTALFVLACIAVGRWWRRAVGRKPLTVLQVAHRVERRYPSLRDLLTSALQFSQESSDTPGAGSETLRRAIVLQASQAVRQVDWEQLIPRRPLRQAAVAAAGAGMVLVGLAWLAPQSLDIGAARLINPLGSTQWPQQHQLELVDPPTLVATGDDLQLLVRDRQGPLPEFVEVHFRTRRAGRWYPETVAVKTDDESASVRRLNVQASFELRATGGDDDSMPWRRVEVVTPPHVDSVQITAMPPDYTQLPAERLVEPYRVLAGSGLELTGATDQPVSQVVLRGPEGLSSAAQVDPGGRSFHIAPGSWKAPATGVLPRSETFWFELTTPAGLVVQSQRKLRLQMLSDAPPEVKFLLPTVGLTLVPSAKLQISVGAKDNVAVRDVELVVRRADRSEEGEQVVSLYRGPEQPPTAENRSAAASFEQASQWSQHQTELDLSGWALQVPTSVELLACARDYRGGTGQSLRPLRLSVVSQEQLLALLAAREQQIVKLLQLALDQQLRLHGQTEAWRQATDQPAQQLTRQAHTALLQQRRVAELLDSAPTSAADLLERSLLSIAQNQLQQPETANRLRSVLAHLEQLAVASLPVIEAALADLSRQTPAGGANFAGLKSTGHADPLDAISRGQDEVIGTLQQVLESLRRWGIFEQSRLDLTLLVSDQRQLLQRSREALPAALQAAAGDARPDQIGDRLGGVDSILSLAREQRQLAQRLAELLDRMERGAIELRDSEPDIAERLAAAVNLSRDIAIQSTLRWAADNLTWHRVGLALTQQRQAVKQLQQLLDRINSPQQDAARQVLAKLQEAESRVQQLRNDLQRWSTDRQTKKPLRDRQQSAMAREAVDLARQAEQLHANDAVRPLERAAQQLREEQGSGRHSERAESDLQQAQERLAAARREQQATLARLQLAQLARLASSLVGDQAAILDQIVELEAARSVDESTGPGQRSIAMQLAERQASVRAELGEPLQAFPALPVCAHLLQRTAEQMSTVEERLLRSQTDLPTQEAAGQALEQLNLLRSAVQTQQDALARDKPAAGGGGEGGAGQKPPADKAHRQQLQWALGQMKLLRAMQAELQQRTLQWEANRSALDQPDESLAREARLLAAEQQELAELANRLASDQAPVEQAAEETVLPNEHPPADNRLDDSQPADEPTDPGDLPP